MKDKTLNLQELISFCRHHVHIVDQSALEVMDLRNKQQSDGKKLSTQNVFRTECDNIDIFRHNNIKSDRYLRTVSFMFFSGLVVIKLLFFSFSFYNKRL